MKFLIMFLIILSLAYFLAVGCADRADIIGPSPENSCINCHDNNHNGNDDGNNGYDGQKKVLICHVPPGNPDNAHTIWISESAVETHLAHGDYLGHCDCEE